MTTTPPKTMSDTGPRQATPVQAVMPDGQDAITLMVSEMQEMRSENAAIIALLTSIQARLDLGINVKTVLTL